MNREEFLAELRRGLTGLPQSEIEERVSFYGEMIDDRTEEGCSEEEAVASIGTPEEIVSQIVSETPLTKIVKEKISSGNKKNGWQVALIILGFPLWFPLLASAFSVIVSFYATVWSLIISLWAVEVAFIAAAVSGFVAAGALFATGHGIFGMVALGVGFLFAGISVLMFFVCVAASRGILLLTKKIALGVKSLFIGKEKTI